MQKKKGFTTRNIALIGILGALAGLFMTFTKFPIAVIAPSFYKLDFSDAIVTLGAFAVGPVGGVFISLIKVMVNLMFDGTATAGIGELSNFLMSCAFVLPAAWIYRRKRSFRAALAGVAVAALTASVFASLINYLLLIPAYVNIMGLPLEQIISMGAAVNASIKDTFTLIVFATLPFNIVKFSACALFVLALCKPVEKALLRAGFASAAERRQEVTQGEK